MAKIKQLTNTFQPRQQSEFIPDIRIDGLAPGLAGAAQSFQAAKGISQQYDMQMAKAQGERAAWELDDWRNNFLIHMDNPQKMKEYFSSTPFASTVAGLDKSTQLYDSTYAQTLYVKAAETAAAGIDDENVRNQWLTSKMREWETIEPEYQAQANSNMQNESRRTEIQNLNSLWKSGHGTSTVEFGAKLDEGYAMGLWTLEQADMMKLNYQQAEQTQVVEARLAAALMPVDENGDGVFDFIRSEEAMNVLVSGLDLSMDGNNYLDEDTMKDLTDKWINKANNYTKLHEQYKAEGEQVYYDNYWQQYNAISSGSGLTGAERTAMAQNLADELIIKYNTTLPDYQTGNPQMPKVSRGVADSDELNKLINKLNSFVSNGGQSRQTEPEALVQALNLISDPSLTPSMKHNALTFLFQEDRLSDSNYKNMTESVDSTSSSMHRRVFSDVSQSAKAEGWLPGQTAELTTQLLNFFETSGGLTPVEVELGAEKIRDSFYDDNTRILGMIDNYQANRGNIWNEGFRARGTFVTDDMQSFQDDVERGNWAGLIQNEAGMFAEYTSAQNLNFKENWLNGRIDYDRNDVVMDGEEPRVVASLVDPYGNALIAVPLSNQSGAEPGTLEVRVFQPTLDRFGAGRDFKAKRSIRYLEVTDAPNYFVATYDENGNQMMIDIATENYGVTRGILASGGNILGTLQGDAKLLQSISLDPNFMAASKAVAPIAPDNNDSRRFY